MCVCTTSSLGLRFMPAVRHLLYWTRGHGSVFTLNMQESLTMQWLCQQRWMLCRNAHRPVHTSTAGKTHTLLVQVIPQKWAVGTTEHRVITSIPTLKLGCLEGLYQCPLHPCYNSAELLLLFTFQPRSLYEGWAQGIPGHFHAPGLIINACYIFSFKTDCTWQQGVAKYFV